MAASSQDRNTLDSYMTLGTGGQADTAYDLFHFPTPKLLESLKTIKKLSPNNDPSTKGKSGASTRVSSNITNEAVFDRDREMIRANPSGAKVTLIASSPLSEMNIQIPELGAATKPSALFTPQAFSLGTARKE